MITENWTKTMYIYFTCIIFVFILCSGNQSGMMTVMIMMIVA